MEKIRSIGLSLAAITCLGLGLVQPAMALPAYRVVNLGSLGGSNASAYGINNAGQVTGRFTTSSFDHHAFIWDKKTGMQDIGGVLGNMMSEGHAINDNRQITGLSINEQVFSMEAFIWEQGKEAKALGSLGQSFMGSNGEDINNLGQVVGNSPAAPNYSEHAFLYDAQGLHDLGTLGGDSSYAYAINESSQIVGNADTSERIQHAFFWSSSTGMLNIGGETAADINDSGEVVGKFFIGNDDNQVPHLFIWEQGTGLTDIGGISGVDNFDPKAINNNGQIVGNTYKSGNGFNGFVYDGSEYGNLNDLIPANSGWVLREANDINDYGQIVGTGMFNGDRSAFLLNPVPEPASMLLLASGLIGMLGIKRRKD